MHEIDMQFIHQKSRTMLSVSWFEQEKKYVYTDLRDRIWSIYIKCPDMNSFFKKILNEVLVS